MANRTKSRSLAITGMLLGVVLVHSARAEAPSESRTAPTAAAEALSDSEKQARAGEYLKQMR